MDNKSHIGGTWKGKEVCLDLNTSRIAQKGCALVGQLETYKTLKEGVDDFVNFQEVNFEWCPFWVQFHGLPHVAFDAENALKLGNVVRRTLIPQRDSIWVSVCYDRLQNYCYDCGRIGHESRNCKFQIDPVENEDVSRYGNGLRITHVKTIEDDLVIHDYSWDEAAFVQRKPLPATEKPQHSRRREEKSTIGKWMNMGEESG
ncbi:hypothetical protein K1719_040580 [Acacia pycnantha]|nr:hypothetical protein K1719_040580 [Acacia pycnantha]